MLPYVGSGDYCYAHSLHMCLLGSAEHPNQVPSSGFLECLTTMPFGNTYLNKNGIFFFDGDTPDQGLKRAAETSGWSCRLERGGDEQLALKRLHTAIQHGPILLGPLDMGYLTYNPNHSYAAGADHFIVLLAIERDHALVHDPKGYPYATLPLDTLLQAWRAERIDYIEGVTFNMHSHFRRVKTVGRQEMIARTLPFIAANLQQNAAGPDVYSGLPALHKLIQILSSGVPDDLASMLRHFVIPLAVRRNLDAAAFLLEGNHHEAARLLDQQARLLGQAQYPATQNNWSAVALLIEQFTTLEERLIAISTTW